MAEKVLKDEEKEDIPLKVGLVKRDGEIVEGLVQEVPGGGEVE